MGWGEGVPLASQKAATASCPEGSADPTHPRTPTRSRTSGRALRGSIPHNAPQLPFTPCCLPARPAQGCPDPIPAARRGHRAARLPPSGPRGATRSPPPPPGPPLPLPLPSPCLGFPAGISDTPEHGRNAPSTTPNPHLYSVCKHRPTKRSDPEPPPSSQHTILEERMLPPAAAAAATSSRCRGRDTLGTAEPAGLCTQQRSGAAKRHRERTAIPDTQRGNGETGSPPMDVGKETPQCWEQPLPTTPRRYDSKLKKKKKAAKVEVLLRGV